GNGLAGDGDDRLLAGDQAHRFGGSFQVFFFLRGGADPHVDDDLIDSGERQLVLAAEFFSQRWKHLLMIALEQARRRRRAGRLFRLGLTFFAFIAFFTLGGFFALRRLLAFGRAIAFFRLRRLGG